MALVAGVTNSCSPLVSRVMILHIDMDAFYASVEERENPRLVGQAVVVGGSAEGRGVVSAANYEARKFGVHSAMPAARAKVLCPHAVFIKPRHELYAAISRQIRDIFLRYTPLVEPLSLDEAFLDVRASKRLFGSAPDIAVRIKTEIRSELNLVASVGVASNKFIAKLASDLDKPDGLVVVAPGTEQSFLDPLPIGCLWGVGKASGRAFQALGIGTIGELRRQSQEFLSQQFGKHGGHLWRLANGLDDREVVPDHRAKSISHETTFAEDVADVGVLQAVMHRLTEQVGRRLRRQTLMAKTAQIKVRFSDFHTITRARSFAHPTQSTREIWEAARLLLETSLQSERRPVRLLGVGASGLDNEPVLQEDLFDVENRQKESVIDQIVDSVNDRFGDTAIHRGSSRKID